MQQVFSFLPILNLKLPRKFPDIHKDFTEEKKKKKIHLILNFIFTAKKRIMLQQR